MSNQGPTVETDPKKIEGLIKTIDTAVHEFGQAFTQFNEKSNPRVKEIMRERMNRFISNAMELNPLLSELMMMCITELLIFCSTICVSKDVVTIPF